MAFTTRRGTLLGAPALLALANPRAATAQAWPGRQVRIVVGFAAGGANDIMARLIAGKLGERIPGTAFVVENRPGAGTLLAAEHVARAAPDGATFLYASTSTLITLLVNRGSGLDPVRDFAAVTMAQSSPLLMVSRPDFPARTLQELLALARQRPVPVSAGTLPTHRPLFIALLVGVLVIVTALTYFPALALGPLAEGLS